MDETELSKHVWNLKDHGLDNNLSWETYKDASVYQCGSKSCDLCLLENVSIICADSDTLLHKTTELISKCRHGNKLLLSKIKKTIGMVLFLTVCSNFFIKAQNKIDIHCAVVFLLGNCRRPLLTISAFN